MKCFGFLDAANKASEWVKDTVIISQLLMNDFSSVIVISL